MTSEPLYLVAVLAALVAASEWLARHTALRHLGSALVVIVLTAIVANVGAIPTYGDDVAVYVAVFDHVAPLGIFWLLLQVDLRSVLRAGLPMLALFLIGALGTTVGVLCGMWAVGGRAAFGELHFALAGMFVGTYTGGSVNFNAIALEYGVAEQSSLYAGAAAVDAAMTTVWMAATVALPRLLAPRWPGGRRTPATGPAAATPPSSGTAALDEEALSPFDVAVMIALGAGAVLVANGVSDWLGARGIAVPMMLVLTTIALALAQVRSIQRLRGARLLGLLAVYLFLAVIGALCDVAALREIGALAVTLAVFVTIVVIVHAFITFGAAAICRWDPATAAVASQANIGGATSALALARSLGRPDLVLPAILVGSFGIAVGNYLGFFTAEWLRH